MGGLRIRQIKHPSNFENDYRDTQDNKEPDRLIDQLKVLRWLLIGYLLAALNLYNSGGSLRWSQQETMEKL